MNSVDRFNPLDYPLSLTWPRLLTQYSTWIGHTPFAMALVDLCRPDRIVELGALNGDSYCAMCQAVEALKLPTQCTAVDTWEGDVHTGGYGPDVLQTLRAHHDPLYGKFSNLMQAKFEDAATQMPDGSIDLLHIDGCHTYAAVKNDYATWKPKMSRRGVIIFHDTQVREPGFGVWTLWEEISRQFPSFEFHHSCGLGVLAVGAEVPPALLRFLGVANREADTVRKHFTFLASAMDTARIAIAMSDNAQLLQEMLNRRKQLIGEKFVPVDKRQAYLAPLQFMEAMMLDMQELTIDNLRQRGFDVSESAAPGAAQHGGGKPA